MWECSGAQDMNPPDTDLRRPTTGLGGALSLLESLFLDMLDSRLVIPIPLFMADIAAA